MKSYYIILALITLGFISCSPDENELCPQSKLKGYSNCTTNYKPWKKGFGYLYDRDSLLIISMGQIDDFCNAESIAIYLKEIKKGRIDLNFSVNANSNYPTSKFDTTHGQDAQTEQYDLMKTYDNYIFINEISNDSSIIKGTFDLGFVFSEISIGKTDPNRPDTLYFQNGIFELHFSK